MTFMEKPDKNYKGFLLIILIALTFFKRKFDKDIF